ncbi:MAG: TIGR02452 family protein [Planctomycetes bacterium]|nr:TIGR02452 family protein [Planctomycetota bacterium]
MGRCTNRKHRAALAQETLKIIEKGSYRLDSGEIIDISAYLKRAVHKTILYRLDDLLDQSDGPVIEAPDRINGVEITAETTLQAALRFVYESPELNPLCLNFASAMNPGGGFLSGSQAQEESLARSSGLYACISQMTEMYEYNKKLNTGLYSDYMIYSPDVPVFRNDEGNLLKIPYVVSFVTSPAVNAGAVRKNEKDNVANIRSIMHRRIERVLRIAKLHGHKAIVLGAWGCGVFDNEPLMIAGLFKEFLGPGGIYANKFGRVVYAIYDRSAGQEIFEAFRKVLAGTL